ncbi:replication-relaxation family protein [Frankia sp. CcI6]|uniref:replication-relaxation family protein n=1 Tax=Frankia sp. CcI6 TaxID=1352929 RepID=UPI000561BBA3|nr:replication-relaxation family protein [Frankia sp. CcI6]
MYDPLIVDFVRQFRHVSSVQVRRVVFGQDRSGHPSYQGSQNGQEVRCRRALQRLEERRVIRTIAPPVRFGQLTTNGTYYQLAKGRAAKADDHTVAVAELYVRLVEEQRAGRIAGFEFTRTPASRIRGGGTVLEPDARTLVRRLTPTGIFRLTWHVEVDLDSEYTEIREKIRRYTVIAADWPGTFPPVLFLVPDAGRARYIQTQIADVPAQYHELFRVELLDEAMAVLRGDK